jgi:hypothetical protein
MYLESLRKKFWEGTITPAVQELAFAPGSVPAVPAVNPAAVETLAAITRHTPVVIAETGSDEEGEWFRLESAGLWNEQLFSRLRSNWGAISGRNMLNFSLVHCSAGPDHGVWLHQRKPWNKPAYLHGCHQTLSWS